MTNNLNAIRPILASLAIFLCFTITAQDAGFIYGKVTTEDGDTYEGPIRWGKEEVYWTDMFNASKEENKNIDYLSSRELDKLEDRNNYSSNSLLNKFINISWEDNDNRFVHEFSCEFGNIKAMKLRSGSRVELKLKNGEYIDINGSGYNDIGTKITVLDSDLGKISLSWSNIDKIEFLPTPNKLNEKFGEPLYGTVESDLGQFTGYIQWDHDERVGTDVLDGDTNDDDDVSIPFDKIKSIERDGYSRSRVELKSGRRLTLRGSNDVDDDNKGIIVTTPGFGRVDLDWSDFDKVTFLEAPGSGPTYDSFTTPKKIKGTVKVDNGDTHKGEIIYDLDEEYTFEVLNGEDDDSKYIIPFKNIISIERRGSDRALVTLKGGNSIMLEDAQDVSERNQGVLIKTNSNRVYVPWDRVEKITLDR